MKLSLAVTVCNEYDEIQRLIPLLLENKRKQDEVVVLFDQKNGDQKVADYLRTFSKLPNFHVIGFPLNKDFASYKNNLKNHAKGIFIFQIDADEIPNEYLITNMHDLLESNKDIDLFFVPRVNTVEGLTDEHIKKWGWNVNNEGWVNWPDLQTRIYRRTSTIEWEGKVHERIKGYNTLTNVAPIRSILFISPKRYKTST